MPTNKQLEDMGFDVYADKQKADTLSQIPKIDTEIFHPITKKISFHDLPTNPLEDFINDQKADGFTFENGTLTKHTHTDPYPFLTDLKDCLDVLLKADLDLSAIQNVAELILENGLRKVYREVNK